MPTQAQMVKFLDLIDKAGKLSDNEAELLSYCRSRSHVTGIAASALDNVYQRWAMEVKLSPEIRTLLEGMVQELRLDQPECRGAPTRDGVRHNASEHPATRSSYYTVDEGCLQCQGFYGCDEHPFYGHGRVIKTEPDERLVRRNTLIEQAQRLLREG